MKYIEMEVSPKFREEKKASDISRRKITGYADA